MTGFDWGLLAAPLCAGLLVCATHIPLGRRVLERGIIFLDLTVAQVAALGVTVVTLWHHGDPSHGDDWQVQVAATASALLAAWLLAWTEQRFAKVQEALIGSLYVLAASATLLFLSGSAHGHQQMHDLLAGQILWVSFSDLMLPLLVTLAVLAAMWLGVARNIWGFYSLFAISVTVSVQLVGIFLVFATLILPALAVFSRRPAPALAIAGAIGIGGYALGLAGSAWLDLPSGPLVVIALAGAGVLASAGIMLICNVIK